MKVDPTYYVVYRDVTVGNEAEYYMLMFSDLRGNTTENLSYHRKMTFVTYDKPDVFAPK